MSVPPRLLFFAFCLLLGAVAPLAAQSTLAFPNAEGFGRFASGGRGGEVYFVTNLNDSGAGSLRQGVTSRTAGVPRTIVFRVSGTIYLNSTLRITQGNLTIAGQTAPGDGICLANYPMDPSNSSDVVIRFIRSRLGDVSGTENDAFNCRYATDLIVDHCSFSWSVDETATAYDNTNFTMQWCFATESLRDSVHSKGAHGYGGIWGGLGATFHHNLLAHHDSRNPRFNGARYHGTDGELVDLRNNVMYNWRSNSTYGGEPTDTGLPARQNMVNNYYRSGPATPTTSAVRYRILDPTPNTVPPAGSQYSLFYINGNQTTASSTVTADNWNGGVQVISPSLYPTIRSTTVFDVAPVVTQSAANSFPLVLAYGGCRLPVRDPVDTRVASEALNGTFTYHGSKGNYAGIIDSQADVGGWPTLATAPAPTDSDSDGMPNTWETAHGLNPNNAADRNFTNAEGYTNLEIYLNELAAPAFPIPLIGTQPQPQTVTAGDPFTLSVASSGAAPFTYQWYRGNNPVSGATTSSYSVASSAAVDAADYRVVVTNGYGSATSNTATVTVVPEAEAPPEITAQPTLLLVKTGTNASFAVTATSLTPMTYQWYRGDRPIAGATGATLNLGPVTFDAAGPYHVVVANPNGSTTSSTATLTVSSLLEESLFSTHFTADTIHAASPVVSPTSTNWYVMSAKNATASVVSNAQFDLTMSLTGSGITETAALFTTTPVSLTGTGELLIVKASFTTTNVRTLGVGLFNSAGSLPYTGLINSQLVDTSSTFATGGTQGWKGYRTFIDAAATTPAVVVEGRPNQPGTTNSSQSLIVPGTSSSAPTVQSIGSTPAAGFSWTDGSTYTLMLTLKRTGASTYEITTKIYTGTDTTSAPIASGVATTTGATLADNFNGLAIGYRTRDGNSVSHVRLSQVSVQRTLPGITVSNAYEAYLASHGLDPATNGQPGTDDDLDTVKTGLEFILGGDPKVFSPEVLPTLTRQDGWRFRFLQHVGTTTAFTLGLSSSTDLIVWKPVVPGTDGVTMTVTPFDATYDQVEVVFPDTSQPALFLRAIATPK